MKPGVEESQESIRRHSKSFTLASRLLSEDARARAVTLYAWCRRADDAVDLAPPEEQATALDGLRRELEAVYGGKDPGEPIVSAFQETVVRCGIPMDYPVELLAGLEMDVRGRGYETLEDLLEYCHRVAGVVGLMMCHVMGVRDERALRNAAHLGIAMQLTNICRDVMEDWKRCRLYLPGRLVAAHGAPGLRRMLGRPFPHTARGAVARTTRDLLADADRFYRSGDAGMPTLSGRSALAIRTARYVYSAIGTRVRSAECDPCAGRAVVPLPTKLGLTAVALLQTLSELPRRMIHGGAPAGVPARVLRFPEDVLPVERPT